MGQHLFDISQRVPHAEVFVSGQAAGPAHGQIQNRRNEIRFFASRKDGPRQLTQTRVAACCLQFPAIAGKKQSIRPVSGPPIPLLKARRVEVLHRFHPNRGAEKVFPEYVICSGFHQSSL